ncbi:hypothetical protein GYMLUDRAFT_238422 [Collybiopsis luxurians FD-317 M1]|nr:hypothetical protein GYMLUDRAFT_238422 [Collybiopsis luxurians FD-317 M1]
MLRIPLRSKLHCFNYSTFPQSFPFPKHSNPTPHQIFHLPHNASQQDIKNRYYQLVRIYHPDKAAPSISSEEAHARFQAISNAYNTLRGKSTPNVSSSARDTRHEATTAARRAAYIRRHRELYQAGAIDDRWKDRLIILATVALFVIQAAMTRQEAIDQVMDRARFAQMEAGINRKSPTTLQDARLSADEEDVGSQTKQ